MKDLLIAPCLALLLLLALASPMCVERPAPADGRMGVVVTIAPLAEYAERVGGDRVSVSVLVPPGGDPHTYEPTPGQLAIASRARAYVAAGSGVEFELAWTDKLLSVNKNLGLINASQGIALIGSADPDEPGADVHVWTSVRNGKKMSENICAGLSRMDPANADYYRANLESYLEELDALDRRIASQTAALEQKKFIVYHPAWGYFARDYGLEQTAIEQDGKEPSARWMEAVIKEARSQNIKVIFASPAHSQASAETLAREVGGRVVLVDPLAKDYSANMQRVAEAFAAGVVEEDGI